MNKKIDTVLIDLKVTARGDVRKWDIGPRDLLEVSQVITATLREHFPGVDFHYNYRHQVSTTGDFNAMVRRRDTT